MLRRLFMALGGLAICVSVIVLAPDLASAQGQSHACGKVGGIPIHAHEISCGTARHIYTADMSGQLPRGWTCSASLARCYRGQIGSNHYMWWKRTNYRLARRASDSVVLGGKGFDSPNGAGWGTERPSRILNGGDLSGLIAKVHWRSWGGAFAIGWGKESIFKPRGGYYRRPVSIKLRAEAIGQCEGRRAYTRLSFRYPSHPGGQLGPWRLWSGDSSICSTSY